MTEEEKITLELWTKVGRDGQVGYISGKNVLFLFMFVSVSVSLSF